MNMKVVLKDDVYDKVFCLMQNITELNEGKEIGAWLTGKWKIDDKEAILLCDKFIIPKQKAGFGSVEIDEDSMIDTIKDIGFDEANRICAHWHIHPFGTGATDWSSIDDEKIEDYMLPEKQREIFVFLLSSLDQIKARVEYYTEVNVPFLKMFKYKERISINDVIVERETPVTKTKYYGILQEEIKSKVEKTVWKQAKGSTTDYKQKLLDDVTNYNNKGFENWLITTHNNYLKLKIDKGFNEYLTGFRDVMEGIQKPDNFTKKGTYVQYGFFNKNPKTMSTLKEKITEIMEEYEAMYLYNDEIVEGYQNKGYIKGIENVDIDYLH